MLTFMNGYAYSTHYAQNNASIIHKTLDRSTKLCMHNSGMVDSFVWCIISIVVAPHCLALEWFVECVDGCIDTRG